MTSWVAAEVRAVPFRLPVVAVLGLTVAFATALHAALALRSPVPWIVPDELIYSELAKSLAEGGLPAIRDETSFAYGVGYPLLLAPAWAIFDDVTTAYAVAKVLNALILGSSVVPAYLLARRFVAQTPALLAAVLTVAVPSVFYAGLLMTEVALYPAFLLAMLAITVAVERPTAGTQFGAIAAIALAVSIKALAVVLLVALVASIVLFALLAGRDEGPLRKRLGEYRITWLALLGVAGIMCALIAIGRDVVDVLGAYAVVAGNVDVAAVPWWFLLHVAELDLYVAVIPFAASLVVIWRGLGRRAAREERLYAALVLPVMFLWVGAVAAFASTPLPGGADSPENVARLHERGTFFLGALFLIGLVIAPARSVGSRRALVATGLVAACLPALIPLDKFALNSYFQALALYPWVQNSDFPGLENNDRFIWPYGCLVVTGALAMLYIARSRLRIVVPAILLIFSITGFGAAEKMEWTSGWVKSRGLGSTPDWIDAAVGDRTVSVLWAEREESSPEEAPPRHRIVWLGEFFNRSVGDVYEIGASMPFGLPATSVRIEGGRVVQEDGRPADLGELVLVPCHVHVAGVPVARDARTEASVVRVAYPLRADVSDAGRCGPTLNS